jgi:hypothetical protein
MTDLMWRKSSHSAENGACVELAPTPNGTIAIRDSKHPDNGTLIFTRAEFGAWLTGICAGEFDDLI